MNHLVTFARVVDGHEAQLRAALRSLPAGPLSPLARTGTVHFGRWVVISRMPGAGRGFQRAAPPGAHLLFSVSFDGDRDAFLNDLCARIADEADRIWTHCVGYPGAADPAALRRWLLEGAVEASYVIAAYPEATVVQVRAALELRDRVVDFAARAQRMDAERAAATFGLEF
jgi:hypothetical protein